MASQKQARKLQATLVWNYDPATDRLTGVKCRATSVAKKEKNHICITTMLLHKKSSLLKFQFVHCSIYLDKNIFSFTLIKHKNLQPTWMIFAFVWFTSIWLSVNVSVWLLHILALIDSSRVRNESWAMWLEISGDK